MNKWVFSFLLIALVSAGLPSPSFKVEAKNISEIGQNFLVNMPYLTLPALPSVSSHYSKMIALSLSADVSSLSANIFSSLNALKEKILDKIFITLNPSIPTKAPIIKPPTINPSTGSTGSPQASSGQATQPKAITQVSQPLNFTSLKNQLKRELESYINLRINALRSPLIVQSSSPNTDIVNLIREQVSRQSNSDSSHQSTIINNITNGTNSFNTICLNEDCISSWPTGGSSNSSSFPFTATTYGVSTSTTIGLLNGFLSTASSTIDSNLTITGALTVGSCTGCGAAFPFSATSYGVSTSTTLGLLNGFISTASSTINSNLIITGNSTTTNATTTNLFATTLFSTTHNNSGLGTFGNLLTTASSTLQNFTFNNATGTSATTTNFFSTTASSTNLFAATANIGNLTVGSCATCGSSFPFTATGYGVSTSTTLGLLNGFISTASSTINSNLLITGNSTTTNATTTNFFSTTASSTNLFSSLLTVGGNALVIGSDRNVGIGTTSPFATLSVTGSANTPQLAIRAAPGQASTTPSFTLLNVSGTPSIEMRVGGVGDTYIGVGAGSANNDTVHDGSNTAVGSNAMFSNTTGLYNSAVGSGALSYNTTGRYNGAFGKAALSNNITGVSNNAFGLNTLGSNHYSYDNSAFGESALYSNDSSGAQTANANSAFGKNALYSNSDGGNNSALGYASLYNNTTGASSTALGLNAGYANTTGSNNLFLGASSNASAVNLSNATAIGAGAIVGASNSMVLGGLGSFATKVGIGTSSPHSTLSVVGSSNTPQLAIQSAYGQASTTPSFVLYDASGRPSIEMRVGIPTDTFIGVNAGAANSESFAQGNNTALGYNALASNTFFGFNTAVGSSALRYSTGGQYNNALGAGALQYNSSGSYNNAFGTFALNVNQTESGNSAFGEAALYSNNAVGSAYNSAFGYYALQNNNGGASSTALGKFAGFTNTTGSDNLFLGAAADASANNLSNATAIGAGAIVGASNSLVLGGSGSFATKVGIGTSTPRWLLQLSTSTAPQLTLSDPSSITNSHWSFRNAGGNLYLATSSASTFATTSTSALTIIGSSGNIGIASSSPWGLFSIDPNRIGQGVPAFVVGSSTATLFSITPSGNPGALFNYGTFSTSTIKDDSLFSWTIATSSSATPIFRIDTTSGKKATSTFVGGLSVDSGAFEYDYGSGITSIDNLNLGSLNFDTDGGILSWIDLPVATTTLSVVESYSAQIDGNPLLTLYSTTDGAGGVSNLGVGIGTTTPSYLLTVTSTTSPQLSLSAGAGFAQWAFRNAEGNLYLATTTVAGTATSTLSALSILNSGGKVGIGTTTPWQTLSVVGGVAFNGLTAAASGNVSVCINSTSKLLYLGSSDTSCTPSSARYKNTIEDSSSGLDELMQLRPVTFYFNDGVDKMQNVGFIAEEVFEIDPRLVQLNQDGEPDALHTSQFLPVIVKSIQELYNKFTDLSDKILSILDRLNGHDEKISDLEARVAELEARLNNQQPPAASADGGTESAEGSGVPQPEPTPEPQASTTPETVEEAASSTPDAPVGEAEPIPEVIQ